jgi:hypothetical protein
LKKLASSRRAFFHNGTALYEINLGQPTRYHVVCKSTDRVEELDAETSLELSRTLCAVEAKLRGRGYIEVGPHRRIFRHRSQRQPDRRFQQSVYSRRPLSGRFTIGLFSARTSVRAFFFD